jgi:hypothetical protein
MSPDTAAVKSPSGQARCAALGLAISDPRSPLPYDTRSDEELLPIIQERAPPASRAECLEALATVRNLCNTVYETCNEYRAGRFGTGTAATAKAVNHLSHASPGFSRREYEEIFAAGLLWTAF